MEFEVDTVGDKHRGSAASDDTICSLLSATLANLVLQPNSDIDSINNSIQSAEALLTAASADICIPARCLENFGVLFERRYAQTKDPDDLQAAITWAELGAAAIPQDSLVRENCHNNVDSYLDSSHEQGVNSQISCKASGQINSAITEAPNEFLAVNFKRCIDGLDSTSGNTKRVKVGAEKTSLTSISAMLADLVSQLSSDTDSLNNAIILLKQFSQIYLMIPAFQRTITEILGFY